MAAEVADDAALSSSSSSSREPCDVLRSRLAGQALAQLAGRRAQQALVLLVGHRRRSRSQRVAAVALEQLAEAAPVLHGDHVPAGRLEHRGDPAGGDVGHDAVERLAVEVDDPQHLAEVRDDRVDDRLPDGALVELRVAEQSEPGARPAGPRSARRRSGARARSRSAPSRRCPTEPVEKSAGHRVLEPARIALQAAELAQRRSGSGGRAGRAGTRSRAGPARRAA